MYEYLARISNLLGTNEYIVRVLESNVIHFFQTYFSGRNEITLAKILFLFGHCDAVVPEYIRVPIGGDNDF